MNERARRRVAVTGLGALSPGGVGIPAYRAWLESVLGCGEGGGLIPNFVPAQYIQNPKLLRSMHRTFQLVAAASVLAMRAANLPTVESLMPAGVAPERAGIAAALADLSPLTPDLLRVLAQTTSDNASTAAQPIGWAAFAEVSLHKLHPFRRLTLLANMAAAHTSLLYGLQGPSFTFTSGGAAGRQTIAQAFWTITHDRADLMLCQTAESPEQSFSACPIVETGGAVVLEAWESAQRRGAAILAELVAEDCIENGGVVPPFSLAEPAVQSPAASLMGALLHLDALTAGDRKAPIALSELLADIPPARLSGGWREQA